MSRDDLPDAEGEAELRDRLVAWELGGRRESAEALCGDRPEWVEAARRRMRAVRRVSRTLDGDPDPPPTPLAPEPATVGPYRVIRRVGEGANGVVYEAEHAATRRRVALKLLPNLGSASDRARRRFAREAELAAQLEHPNVAAVYDAGEAGGVAYLAMQFIDGRPADEHAAAAGLDRRGRVALVLAACRGVAHAHAKGVIHRDLKPANLLVDAAGAVRVVDFGLAKAIGDGRTAVSLDAPVLGTLAFAAPEQCRGEASDAAADVYALGATLFCLLLPGEHPHDLGGGEGSVRWRVGSTPARRPRSLDGDFDRDLDAIITRATAFEPPDRYATVAALGEDLARWLEGRPVQARPASAAYLLRRWAGRHKRRVALGAFALVAIALLLTGSAWRIVRERNHAQAAEAAAEAAAREAEDVGNFLEELLAALNPAGGGRYDVTVAEMLDAAEARVGDRFAGRPLVEARARRALGRTLTERDRVVEGGRQTDRAVELLTEYAGPDDPRTLAARLEQARNRMTRWQSAEAEAILRDALPRMGRVLGPTDATTLEARRRLAAAVYDQGRVDEAGGLAEALFAGVAAAFEESDPTYIRALGIVATFRAERGDWAGTLPLAERAYRLAERHLGRGNATTLSWLLNYAEMVGHFGDLDKAVALFRENARRRTETFGPDNEGTHYGRQVLAGALLDRAAQGDVEEAVELLHDLRRLRPTTPRHLPTRLAADLLLADALRRLGRGDEADAVLAEESAAAEATLLEDRPLVALVARWAEHLKEAGGDAAGYLARAAAAVETAYGPDSPQAARVRALHKVPKN